MMADGQNPSSPASGKIVFPNNIRRYRHDRGLSIEKLAFTVRCSPKHLSRLELGYFVPKAILLHDMARALNVLTDMLYHQAEP